MTATIELIIRRMIAILMTVFAFFNINPIKTEPSQPNNPDATDLNEPYTFSDANAYKEYYFYYTEAMEREVRAEQPDCTWLEPYVKAREHVEAQVEYSGFRATLYKNKTARIDGMTKATSDVLIPADINGYKVVMIYGLFDGSQNKSVKKIVVPDTVEYIDEDVFYACYNLKSVQLGNRVKYLGAGAFNGCSALTSVTLPENVTAVQASTFADCFALTEVKIGTHVTSLEEWAFSGCYFLKEVKLPESLTSIGKECFSNCKNMTSVYIPASVAEIEKYAFLKCNKLTIHGVSGSIAEAFAKENQIPFVAEG